MTAKQVEVVADSQGRVDLSAVVGGPAYVAKHYLATKVDGDRIILEPAVVLTRAEYERLTTEDNI